MLIYWTILILVITARQSDSQCSKCSPMNVKCISSTEYQYCNPATNELIVDTKFKCKTGELCNTGVPPATPGSPCIMNIPSAPISPDCKCGTCTGQIACVSDTQFQLCLRGSVPSGDLITCPAGTKCNPEYITNNGNFCDLIVSSGCPAEVSVSVKCSTTGKFPIPKTACKSYYLCSLVNNQLRMYNYTCTGTMKFDPLPQKCTSTYVCPA